MDVNKLNLERAIQSPKRSRVRAETSNPGGTKMRFTSSASMLNFSRKGCTASPRNPRPLSVDEGISALIIRFYSDKLEEAKKTVDEQLQQYRKDILGEIKKISLSTTSDSKEAVQLDVLANHSKNLLVTDPFLSSTSYKTIIAEIMKLKDDKQYSGPLTSRYLNLLLLVISKLSRLMGYLVCFSILSYFSKKFLYNFIFYQDIDQNEIDSFVNWAADGFLKEKNQEKKQPSPVGYFFNIKSIRIDYLYLFF